MSDRIYSLGIDPDSTTPALMSQMRSLVEAIVPTQEQRDRMVLAWVDRAGAKAAEAVGVAGVEVYVPLNQFEVVDGSPLAPGDIPAAIETARAALASMTPNHDDLVAVATLVLGADVVAALGI